jgi:glycosyltransferase involved in cell wall biosynthesis
MSSSHRGAAEGRPVILQVLPGLVSGGAERAAVDVAQAIVDAGAEAIVASAGGPMAVELRRTGARHVTLPLDSKNPFIVRRNATRLARLIEAEGVDIVHARSRAPAWSAYWAARRTRRHFLTSFHGVYDLGGWVKRRYNSVMVRGERVIAVSDYVADHIRENYPVEPGRIRTIRRGIDLSRFDPERVTQERVIQLAQQWRLADGVPVVMLAGRLSRWKGQMVFLEALARLGGSGFDQRCLIVGPEQGRGRYRAELERAARRLGVDGIVQFTGDCRDMPAAFMLADVVVSASTEPEAFGRVIAEAQAMGRVVIATDHGGAREQVLPERTGWLVKPGDPEALAAALAEALALAPGERLAIGRVAAEHARATFSKETMCERTLGVYEELLRADAYENGPMAA